ncbi:hypothetical protein HDG42_007769 [Paraburkholderia sp. JPY171]|nr:hypothetical protein [Paraburkholderia atlantica]
MPLLGQLDESGGITTPRQREVLRRFFHTAADVIQVDHPALAGKLQRATPHWLRHTHATHALARGATLTTVRDNLRHASITTTSIYLGTTTRSSVPGRSSGSSRDGHQHEHRPRDHLPGPACRTGHGGTKSGAYACRRGIRFVRRQSRQEATAVLIMVQLKLLQRLGYFPMLSDVPPVIIDHIRTAMRARALPRTAKSISTGSGNWRKACRRPRRSCPSASGPN